MATTPQYQAMTTVTGASNLAASTALMSALKTLILLNTAWTAIEDVTPTTTTTTNRWIGFKCAAASSGLTNDFYMLLYQAATGALSIAMGEAYNTSTHTISNTAIGSNISLTPTSAGQPNGTLPSLTLNASTGVATQNGTQAVAFYVLTTGATTLFYQAVVYQDHIVVGSGTSQANVGGNGGTLYIGGYTSLVPTPATNDPYNIVCGQVLTASALGMGCPREPLQLASVARTSALAVSAASVVSSLTYLAEYQRSQGSSAVDYIQGTIIPMSRIYLMEGGNVGGVAGIMTRGLFSNLVYTIAVPTSIAIGDTITYNGHSWVYLGLGLYIDSGS